MTAPSIVRAVPPADPREATSFFEAKLTYETDCADVYVALKNRQRDFVLLDVRSREAYAKSHAMTAINLPQGEIDGETLAPYPADTVFVVYCWGPGCNGATRAAAKIAALGYQVKEMIGGIQVWEDYERYPVTRRMGEAQA